MLEFDEAFFVPEIRNDFYIDSTMKTVWAAELEIVSEIAIICERHGLTWYIGFGTLLGAIRHEGFIPWDDDVDLMMPRKDYMKFLEIASDELPEGLFLKSAVANIQFKEYQSVVTNGNVVSFDSKRIKQFHGCPFSVAIDIFPLDYLPRNEKKRKNQKDEFILVFSVIEKLREINNLSSDDRKIDESISEVLEGIHVIENIFKYRFNYMLIEQCNWNACISELWKLANKIAMRYSENDSDSLAMYCDYVLYGKEYKKEWLQEVYSATFETFMLPIPNGYDEILRTIYGNYERIIKNCATHEYPYYLSQLREIKEFYNKLKLSKGEIVNENEGIQPENWKDLIGKKKVILFVNEMYVACESKELWLEKLERVLLEFERAKDNVVLWWRPQNYMSNMFKILSDDMVIRYEEIINKYVSDGWGIIDFSDNIDRAMDIADAYYGDRNVYVKRMTQMKKPVMILNVKC